MRLLLSTALLVGLTGCGLTPYEREQLAGMASQFNEIGQDYQRQATEVAQPYQTNIMDPEQQPNITFGGESQAQGKSTPIYVDTAGKRRLCWLYESGYTWCPSA